MTYHSVSNKLMCHYCGYISHMVEKCSSCGSENIRYSGVGTQKIEADLKAMIPNAKILRIDADILPVSVNSQSEQVPVFLLPV